MAAWLREAVFSTAVACASLTADPSAAQTAAAASSQNGARFAVVRAAAAGVPVRARGSAIGQIPSEAIVVATGRVRRGARVVWREVSYGELIGWVDARHLAPYPDG